MNSSPERTGALFVDGIPCRVGERGYLHLLDCPCWECRDQDDMDTLRPCQSAGCQHLARPYSSQCSFHSDSWDDPLEDRYDEDSNADSCCEDGDLSWLTPEYFDAPTSPRSSSEDA